MGVIVTLAEQTGSRKLAIGCKWCANQKDSFISWKREENKIDSCFASINRDKTAATGVRIDARASFITICHKQTDNLKAINSLLHFISIET